MYNILLDKLPNEYNGYLIRTSFRIGIQICMCLDDVELDDTDKMLISLNLLYGNGMPELESAIDGLRWFMACGNPEYKSSDNNDKTLFYWDFDSSRLYSSFKQTYSIDLAKSDLHWFEFIALLGSLDKDSALSKAIEIRDYDIKDVKGKARTDLQKMKKSLTPPIQYNEEEQQKIEEFNSLLNGGDVNG